MRMMRPPVREENVLDNKEQCVETTTTTPIEPINKTFNIVEPQHIDIVDPPYNLGFTKELKVESSVTVTTKKGGYYKFSITETRETNPNTNIEQAKQDMFDRLNESLDNQIIELRDAGII